MSSCSSALGRFGRAWTFRPRLDISAAFGRFGRFFKHSVHFRVQEHPVEWELAPTVCDLAL